MTRIYDYSHHYLNDFDPLLCPFFVTKIEPWIFFGGSIQQINVIRTLFSDWKSFFYILVSTQGQRLFGVPGFKHMTLRCPAMCILITKPIYPIWFPSGLDNYAPASNVDKYACTPISITTSYFSLFLDVRLCRIIWHLI